MIPTKKQVFDTLYGDASLTAARHLQKHLSEIGHPMISATYSSAQPL